MEVSVISTFSITHSKNKLLRFLFLRDGQQSVRGLQRSMGEMRDSEVALLYFLIPLLLLSDHCFLLLYRYTFPISWYTKS